ncbi:protein O-linked-mannose beta-1,2-N-acetylglucosaminyltransferase 1-like isoform X2 [Watersipora subatra]|uniref:protein O-linked-mannose beta-1,2-N-acetylglucosaminyltransferase 1-like isoform X2 n=1 Tax=Watersipora subatra TaxID=2589382 RepID=UPI00355C97BC
MGVFACLVRRSKDSWTVFLVLIICASFFFWNYSAIPSGTKEVPLVVSPLSIDTRQVQSGVSHPKEDQTPGVDTHDEPAEVVGSIDNEEADSGARGKEVQEKDKEEKEETPAAKAPKDMPAPVTTPAPLKSVPPPKTGVPCPVRQSCEPQQFSYFVQSGQGINQGPIICYNNELVMGAGLKDKTWNRGANIVVIHPDFKTVMDRKSFDLYDSVDNCMEMAKYLSTYVPFKAQILLASFDDMSANLCKSVRTLLNQYGSSIIKDLKFRENYVLVGEKGLPGNFGFEKREPLNNKEWPIGPVNVSGCASHPISPKYVDVDIIKGYHLENCGVQKCGYDEIEIHIATMGSGLRVPKLCIGSTYIFYPGYKGSRGFNVVELDPISKTIVNTAEYDTYQVESSRLEIFLENVQDKNFLIVIVADDGSTSLKKHARELLKTFGFNGDVITMRTALYFVGRRGMKTTPIQRVSQPDDPKTWPPAINERFCLPTELTEATEQQMSNKARTDFCAKHDSFADFCFVHHKTEPLIAASKLDSYEEIKEVFEVPILVLGGVNNIAMSHTLQSLIKQPGLNKKMVFVAYSTMFGDDYKPFIDLFEFRHIEIKPISKYVQFLSLAFEKFWELNPTATHCIVIDDEIVAKTGFLWYMGHALKAMAKDSSIGAASGWNPQGFAGIASDPSAVHVLSQFAGQAFLIPKTFYIDEIKGKETKCCNQRSIQQWFQSGTSRQYKYIVPEISRAGYFSPTAYSAQTQPLSDLAMSMPRTAASLNLTNVPLVMETVFDFDTIVTNNLKDAYFTTEHDMSICKTRKEPGAAKLLTPFLPSDKKHVAVVYSQSKEDDHSALKPLYSCFGLMYMDGYSPFGMYNGVTMLTLERKRVYLVSTSSQFYKKTIQSMHPYIISF